MVAVNPVLNDPDPGMRRGDVLLFP